MTTKLLLLVAAVTLCCCISSLHARGCRCIRTTTNRLPLRAAKMVQKVEVIPISGSCRRTEVIFTMIRGNTICADPNAEWVNLMIEAVQRRNEKQEASDSATDPPMTTNNSNSVGGHSIL